MEEEKVASHEIPVVKVVEDDTISDVKAIHVDAKEMDETKPKKEEEETPLDGEFIKVEKEEPLDITCSPKTEVTHSTAIIDEQPLSSSTIIERSNSSPSRELLESQEKVQELETELEKLSAELKHSESENASLKADVVLTKEKSEEAVKNYEQLELSHKKLADQLAESEEKHTQQIKLLQEAIEAHDSKHKALVNTQEAFDNLKLELENSRKKMEEVDQELQRSTGEAQKFEELHKESGSHAELETKRALEFENLLEMAKLSAKEVEAQMKILQEEVKGLYEKIAENEKVENALKSTSETLSVKESLINELTQELEETKLKLGEGENAKELASKLQEEISKVIKEKEAVEAVVTNLTENSSTMKALCSELEEKLQTSDQSLDKTNSHLSEALASNADLEQKLRALEELHHESGYAVTAATQQNIELQEKLQASKVATEEANVKLKELEASILFSEQKKVELEQQLNLVQLKSNDTEREIKELSEKLIEITSALKDSDEAKKVLEEKVEEYEKTVKKASEFELLLETEKYRIQELEEEISGLEKKHGDAEEGSRSYSQKASELETELESFRSKEKELTELLNLATEEKKNIEESLSVAQKKLQEVEIDLSNSGLRERDLKDQLKYAEEQLEEQKSLNVDSVTKIQEVQDSYTSRDTEVNSLYEKISSLEEKVGQSLSENEMLVETNTELKKKVNELQDLLDSANSEKEGHTTVIADLSERHLKVSELHSASETQLQEAIQKLKLNEEQVREVEKVVEELKSKSEIFEKESGVLGEENSKLVGELADYKSKLSDLESKLSAVCVEKDEAIEELQSSKKAIEDLTQQFTSAEQKLQSQISSIMEENNLLNETHQITKTEFEKVIKQLEEQLKEEKSNYDSLIAEIELLKGEVSEKSTLKTHLQELQEKLVSAEARVKEEVESVRAIAVEKESELSSKLEEHVQKVRDRDALEELVQTLQNELKLAQLTISQQKESESQKELERESALKHSIEEIDTKNKAVLLLEQQVKELEETLQLAETKSKEKVESVRAIAVEKESELSSKLEEHVQKVRDRDALEEQVQNLQNELKLAQVSISQQKESETQKELERESALKHSIEEIDTKNKAVLLLEQQVKELEEKLQLAETKSKEKEVASEIKEGVEVKSRDIGSSISTPTKRKSKKKSESAAAAAASSVQPQKTTHLMADSSSSALPFKLIMGIALVSVIIGVILGKKY